jgi:hypothetical protein
MNCAGNYAITDNNFDSRGWLYNILNKLSSNIKDDINNINQLLNILYEMHNLK